MRVTKVVSEKKDSEKIDCFDSALQQHQKMVNTKKKESAELEHATQFYDTIVTNKDNYIRRAKINDLSVIPP